MNLLLPRLTAFEAVRSPRGPQKLAVMLAVIFVTLPGAMTLVPWQQNVSAIGRVTALDPLDRTQVLPAPVTGRLVELLVQEGDRVKKGATLARLEDLDASYSLRLEQTVEFARSKMENMRESARQYERQLESLEDAREQAISQASSEIMAAIEKVRGRQHEVIAAEALRDQKLADRVRRITLYKKGLSSELQMQEAVRDYDAAAATVEAARAGVEEVRREEEAKSAAMSRVSSEWKARVESTRSTFEEANSKVQVVRKELNEATTALERQRTQEVIAPRDGTVLRVHAALTADLLQRGQPLIELIPHTDKLCVELWVRGIDGPLIERGRKVRLQFEGWPAVQFVGWPSVAVGTFGGVVEVVDAASRLDGRFRVLIRPDPEDEPWPHPRYLRQGVRTNGWILLDEVRLGYEIWRQLNAFPPTVEYPSSTEDSKDLNRAGAKDDGEKEPGS